jgi:small subunit ribosomal protein S20
MANTVSAKKSARQNQKRRLKNSARRTALKTSIKKVLLAIEQDAAKAPELLQLVASQLGRAKSKKVIHKRKASRILSRLSRRVNEASKAA